MYFCFFMLLPAGVEAKQKKSSSLGSECETHTGAVKIKGT